MPAMQSVAARFGKDARLALVSVSLMDGPDAIRAAADKLRMNWAQWILTEDMILFSMDWDLEQQHLGLVLIDPRGRLISRDLKGDAAEETVARVLAGRPAR